MTDTTRLIADLARLVAIPSIGALPEHAPDLEASAAAVADLLADAGCPDVRVVSGPYAPAVIGRWPAPAGQPTVCLYCHHDVQALGDPGDWDTDPLTLTQVGDRLYGRGSADDKGGIAVHVAALRAFGGRPPVGVTVFVEGEEEIGSPHSAACLAEHADLLRADAYVVLDAGNWAVGVPAFTTTLRGVADVIVEVATLDHALHSGQYGGVAPDALTALCHLLASFHSAEGDVVIAGIAGTEHFDVDYAAEDMRAQAGLLDGVRELGTGSIADRLWAKPSLTVIGLDTVSVANSSNTLLPTARARVSLRVPPGMTGVAALDALVAHCETHAPWGAKVTVTRGSAGNPGQVPVTGPLVQAGLDAYEAAFGTRPVLMGQGGAIPLVEELTRAYPGAELLVTGICDPDSRMHAPNESVSLADLVRTVDAETRFLAAIAR